jgi:hypothetical protein
MRLYLLAFAAVFATAALGEDDCRCWTPDAEQLAAVEATLASRPLPLGSLVRYVRYYAGTFSSFNRRFIRGKLVPASGEMDGIFGTGPRQDACPESISGQGHMRAMLGAYADIRIMPNSSAHPKDWVGNSVGMSA